MLAVATVNETDRTGASVPLQLSFKDQALFTQRWGFKGDFIYTNNAPYSTVRMNTMLSQTAWGQQEPPSLWWGSVICPMPSVIFKTAAGPPAPVVGLLFPSRGTFLLFILLFLLIYNHGKAPSSIKANSETFEPKRVLK